MGAEDPFWERIEGARRPDAQDAQHWLRVYQELLRTLRTMEAADGAADARLPELIRTMEDRLRFWTATLHDAPVVRARRPRRALRRDRSA
jgi:hypothetical protein